MYDIQPDLTTLGKGLANGFPLSALAGGREVMCLGGPVEDRDRVFLASQTYGRQPWALAAMLATIGVHEREDVVGGLHRKAATLRAGVEDAVRAAGLQDHVQVAGRDCKPGVRHQDRAGERSQALRTVFLQKLLRHGVLAPSFVVSHSHDEDAVARTVAAPPVYARGLEEGPETVLPGRPVPPAVRHRG